MCLIAFAWRPGHALPLLLAGNRDEFYARPSAALAAWPEAPGVYAGRDLEAGGSWLGIGPNGRFAAVTNIRNPGAERGARSRGELVAGFLLSDTCAGQHADTLWQRAAEYSGFNLLLGDGKQLYHLASQHAPQALAAGVYGLSNAALNTPWPKTRALQSGLAALLDAPEEQALFALLHTTQRPPDTELPSTGISMDMERLLSSAFIHSATYGTRASTLLYAWADGRRRLVERRFGPEGIGLGETALDL